MAKFSGDRGSWLKFTLAFEAAMLKEKDKEKDTGAASTRESLKVYALGDPKAIADHKAKLLGKPDDDAFFLYIAGHLEGEPLDMATGLAAAAGRSGCGLWEALWKRYGGASAAAGLDAFRALLGRAWLDTDTPTSYANDILNLRTTHRRSVKPEIWMSDFWVRAVVLDHLESVNERFSAFVAIEHDKDAALDQTKAADLEAALRHLLDKIPAAKEDNPFAGYAGGHGRKPAGQPSGRGRGGGSRGGGSRSSDKRACYRCGSTDHLKRDCPQADDSKKEGGKKEGKTGFVGIAAVLSAGVEAALSLSRKAGVSTSSFVVDSGATRHLVHDRAMLTEFRELGSGAPQVITANEEKLQITGVGKVRLQVVTRHGEEQNVVLHDVLLAPDLGFNLLSPGRVMRDGHNHTGVQYVSQQRSAAFINDAGDTIELRLAGGLEWLVPTVVNGTRVSPSEKQQQPEPDGVVKVATTVQFKDWHARLNHINQRDAKMLAEVAGVKLVGTQGFCEPCVLANQRQASVSKGPKQTVATTPGGRVHADLTGPFPGARRPHKFAIVVCDEYTRDTRVCMMPNKSNASKNLIDYAELQDKNPRHPDFQLKGIFSDNDSVFDSTLRRFCGKNNIGMERSPPGVPSYNGLIEAKISNVTKAAKALLLAASLDNSYINFALEHATMVSNFTPTAALKGKCATQTPHEMCTGKVPPVHMLRKFGSVAYVWVPKAQRRKMGSNSIRGIFIGLNLENRSYRVLIEKNGNRSVRESISVTFDESNCKPLDLEPPEDDVEEEEEEDNSDAASEGSGNAQDLTDDEQDTSTSLTSSSSTSRVSTPPPASPPSGSASPRSDSGGSPLDGDDLYEVEEVLGRRTVRGQKQVRVKWAGHTKPQWITDDQLKDGILDLEELQMKAATQQSIEDMLPDMEFGDEDDVMVATVLATAVRETKCPRSLKQALATPEAASWQAAVDAEMKSHHDNHTYEEVSMSEVPENAKVLGSQLLFSVKDTGAHKVRFVIMGNQQEKADPTLLFAPVASMKALRVLISLAAAFQGTLKHIDLRTAFLHASLSKEEWVYTRPPPGLGKVDEQGRPKVWRVLRAIYGLPGSPKSFNTHLNAHMLKQKFKRSASEPCLYVKNKNANRIWCVWYVDDAYYWSMDSAAEREFEQRLAEAFTIGTMEEASSCLGMELTRDINGGYKITQTTMMREILEKAGMADCRTVQTPLASKDQRKNPAPDSAVPLEGDSIKNYRSLVCSVAYVSTCSRPDLSFSVGRLARALKAPTVGDQRDLVQLLKYVRGTPRHGLQYDGGTQRTTLEAFVDADFGVDPRTGRSVTGFVFLLNGSAVAFTSRLQESVSSSSTQAEYQALSTCIMEGLYLRYIMADFGFPQRAVKINEDNKSAIFIATTESATKHSKHIHPRYHFCREHIQRKNFEVVYVSTHDNAADVLTKGLSPIKHRQFTSVLLGGGQSG
jgi:hypothetical protein